MLEARNVQKKDGTSYDPAARRERQRRYRERKRAGLVGAPVGTPIPEATDDAAPPPPPRDTAPRNVGGRPAGYSPKGSELTRIRTGLVMMFTALGMGVSMADSFDGQVIATNAEKLADAWTQVAENNARVRKTLVMLLEGSAWGSAVMTTAMVTVPMLAHHGLAPDSMVDMSRTMGVEIPDVPGSRPRMPAPGSVSQPRPPSVPSTPPDVAPGAGRVNGRGEPADVPEQSFDDVGLPGYAGPPDRAA